jgi:branched-chain amino acid aminotransferase
MNGHAAETVNHLTETGVDAANAAIANPAMHDIDASLLKITKTSTLRTVPEPNSAEVWASKSCTDHMVTVTWTADYGWHAPEIKPYGPISMMPTASCLHYATQCFEGMKVYRGYDGKLRLFRPDKNCSRLVMSSTRVALPAFDPVELEKLIKALMKLDGARK